ncbi:MAG: RsbRD N-terminal domain-containing protein, partial [Thermodesulfobacteriota bacterium]
VQEFSASQAVAFIFSLKKVVREEIKGEGAEPDLPVPEVLEFESKIDALALRAFDMFMGCRERIYEIRATEIRNRTMNLLRRAGLLSDIPEGEEDLAGGGVNGG